LLPKLPDPFLDRRARHGELLDTPNRPPEHVPSPPGSPTGVRERAGRLPEAAEWRYAKGVLKVAVTGGHNLVT
jgi:hypothetical protein